MKDKEMNPKKEMMAPNKMSMPVKKMETCKNCGAQKQMNKMCYSCGKT